MDFLSYLLVTQVNAVMPVPISSALVSGTVRFDTDDARLSLFEIRLDTETSTAFRERH